MIVFAKEGQSIVDVVLQFTGGLDSLMHIIAANPPLTIESYPGSGTPIFIDNSFVQQSATLNEIRRRQIVIQSNDQTGVAPTPTPGVDPDAQAYINAYNALSGAAMSATEEAAIDRFVKNLKGVGADNATYDWWTDRITILPFRGVTSARQALVLGDPLNPTTFSGGVTHTSTGVSGNGINGYYNFFDSSLAQTDDVSVWVYKQTNQATDRYDFGAQNTSTARAVAMRSRSAAPFNNVAVFGFSTNQILSPNAVLDGSGLVGVSKHATNGFDAYYQGLQIQRAFDVFVDPGLVVAGLARRTQSGVDGYDNNTHSLAMALRGIPTSTEADALKSIVDIFMTDLGINVP